MESTAERFKKLFLTNPMKMEVVRFKTRFVNCTSNPKLNRALVVLVVTGYLCVLGLIAADRHDISQSSEAVGTLLMIQAGLIVFGAVLGGHGAIASERDKRSWDLLQVAPISQAQIVVGKFQGLLALVGLLSLGMLPMVLLLMPFSVATLWSVLVGECIVMSFGSAVAAFTLYLSARLKNANTALAAAVASIVAVFVVAPLAIGAAVVMAGLGNALADLLMIWHPFYVLVRIFFPFPPNENLLPIVRQLCGFPQIAGYMLLTYLFLSATTNLLNRKSRQ